MKRELILLLSVVLVWSSCSTDSSDSQEQLESEPFIPARTDIPDRNFEQSLVNLGLDDEVDGSVLTSSINTVENLIIEGFGITDLTGIADFTALEGLWASNNGLTSLDVSQNSNIKFVFANDNELTSLNVNNLSILERIAVINNKLTSLNISNNLALQQLSLSNNELGSIDVSRLPSAIQLSTFSIEDNPLTCIKVNQSQLQDIPSQWTMDPEDNYSLDCN